MKEKLKALVLIINIKCPEFQPCSLVSDRADDSLKRGNPKRINMAETNHASRLI